MGALHSGVYEPAALAAQQIRVPFRFRSASLKNQKLQPYHTFSQLCSNNPLRHIGLVEALHDNYRQFAWEAEPRGPGLTVYNAYTKETMQVYYAIIRTIEDSVGLTKPVCCHSQPAYIGISYH